MLSKNACTDEDPSLKRYQNLCDYSMIRYKYIHLANLQETKKIPDFDNVRTCFVATND